MAATEKRMNFIRVFNLPQSVFFHLPKYMNKVKAAGFGAFIVEVDNNA